MEDGPERAFVCEELIHISKDTQAPPDWVSEWKKSQIIFVTPSGYKKMITSNGQMNEECMRALDCLQKTSGKTRKGIQDHDGR